VTALILVVALVAAAAAGAWLFDLARSGWGDRHPRLRELALLFAFTIGVAMLAAVVTMPARIAWAMIASAPPPPALELPG